jgi:hypothetical protein
MSEYGAVALTADPWINARAQAILTAGLPDLPPVPAELRKFNPLEERDERGRWSIGGAVIHDLLKLAGKIDLDSDERLIGSDKLDMRGGGIRLALTETHGVKSFRLGIGGEGFGHGGVWHGNRGGLGNSDDPGGIDGFTAKLDASAVERLRATLIKALADGKSKQTEVDKAYDAGLSDPPRPEQGFWTMAEGSISGEWADIAYNVYLDDPSVGVEVHLGAVPHDTDRDLADLTGSDQAARLDPAEAQKFVKLLGEYVSASLDHP